MIELARNQLQVRLQACLHSLDEFVDFESMRILRGNAQGISVDRAILFSWQMFGRCSG